MRNIKFIAIHCTATSQDAKVESILNYWKKNLGWKNPGYHFIIDKYGTIINLLPITKVSNGVRGYNSITINIAYIGGIDEDGVAIDNRTATQKKSLLMLIESLKNHFPDAVIQGHRDFPNVKKACPSFNAKIEYKDI